MGFSPIAPVPVDIAKAAPAAPLGDTRERIKATAKDFEASFLSVMMGEMFNGVGEGPFSGGQGGTMFKSFLIEAMSKQMTKTGGVGVSDAVQREMLKLQGLEG
jgi:Rod binding domain-containing protein